MPLLTGDHFIVAALHGRWGVAGFDIGAIALAVGYVVLARATQRRARKRPGGIGLGAAPGHARAGPRNRPCARPTRPDVPASSPSGRDAFCLPSAQVLFHRLLQVRDQVA